MGFGINVADIAAIKAKTDLLPASPASEVTSAAVKAKTDLLPASPASEVTSAAVKAKTDLLPSDPADESLLEAAIATRASQTSLDTVAGYVDSEVAAIKAKTDLLPSDPASESGAITRKFPFLDFWSLPEDILTVTSSAADITFPNIVVAGLPVGFTLKRVVLILTIRAIKDSSAADNKINAASKTLRIKKSTGSWGTDDVVGITFDQNSLYCVASSKEGGPTIIGDTDIKGEVDDNATYNVMSNQTNRSDAIVALGNNLVLYDIQVGVRVFYE